MGYFGCKKLDELNLRCDAYICQLEREDRLYWRAVERAVRQEVKAIKESGGGGWANILEGYIEKKAFDRAVRLVEK